MLAPAFIGLLAGTVLAGLYVQNYNAARNVVNDTSRFAMVEYQRGNKIDSDALQARAVEVATGGKYNLNEDDLTVTVTPETTQVDGVRQMKLSLAYTPAVGIPLFEVAAPTIRYQRDIYMFDPESKVGS